MSVRRRLNRIFVILWIAWAVYAIVIYPSRLWKQHQDFWSGVVQFCTETKVREGASWTQAHDACLKENQTLWDEGVRLYGSGRSAEAWLPWILLAVIPPPIVYLVILGTARVVRWVGRGFEASS